MGCKIGEKCVENFLIIMMCELFRKKRNMNSKKHFSISLYLQMGKHGIRIAWV
jgi:hypothetical protein